METKNNDSRKALLVIDVQEDYTGEAAKAPFPYKNSSNLIHSINKMIELASEKNIIVVYVKQEYDGFVGKLFSKVFCRGTTIKGNPGAEFDKRINIISSNIFPKMSSTAFSNPMLNKFLQEHKVDTVYLTGVDAQYCVYGTAMVALKHGYNVFLIKDGTALLAEQKWNEILKKYESNGVKLITSEDFSNV